jgi:hypothetical protein
MPPPELATKVQRRSMQGTKMISYHAANNRAAKQ